VTQTAAAVHGDTMAFALSAGVLGVGAVAALLLVRANRSDLGTTEEVTLPSPEGSAVA
jgi:hypothetical protein